jgi:signal peptidase I
MEPTAPIQPYQPQPNPEQPVEAPSLKPSRKEGFKSILSTILILISAPLIALTITSFVFQSYEVDGESMETTLQHRDRLIVYKFPKTLARITHKSYIPARGTIVVFAKAGTQALNQKTEKQLIKRVIGLPGERVVIKDGVVTIYNNDHPTGFSPDSSGTYPKITQLTTGNVDLTVPPSELFVMGDNRSNSLDSRSFGTIENHELVGRLAYRILPLNKVESY